MSHTESSAEVAQACLPTAVYTQTGGVWLPSILSRGPWDLQAQHGGAPSALLAHLAESVAPDPGWQLSRLTIELVKPVPVAPLTSRTDVHPARSTIRATIDLYAGEVLVARGHALLVRGQPLSVSTELPGGSPARLLPSPADCGEPMRILGLPDGVFFHATTMESLMAQGDSTKPGPAAAWFRLTVPLVEGQSNSPAMRAAAAADFGNGLSWILPFKDYLFANADLNIHLHRQPEGEWVGIMSETQAHTGGMGTILSRLYDVQGAIGVATQTVLLRKRDQ